MYEIFELTNLTNNRKFIGHKKIDADLKRSVRSNKELYEDIKNLGINFFSKKILLKCLSKKELQEKKREFLDQIKKDVNSYNFHIYKKRTILTVKDQNNNIFKVKKDDPRYLSGELISNYKGKGNISVKDINGNRYNVKKDDPRYLSGELVGITKGITPVIDKDGNKFQVSKNDPRLLSGELFHPTKNTVQVKDKNGKIFRVSINDIRYLNGELMLGKDAKLNILEKRL
jgi:hypothetical protein